MTTAKISSVDALFDDTGGGRVGTLESDFDKKQTRVVQATLGE